MVGGGDDIGVMLDDEDGEHGEAEAERLIKKVGHFIGLQLKPDEHAKLRKGDEKKVLLAVVLRKRTTVGLRWISERLTMGHSSSVSRLIKGVLSDAGSCKK